MDVMDMRRGLMMAQGKSGRDYSVEAAIIGKALEGRYENPLVTVVASFAFYNANGLTSVSFPNCLSIEDSAFRNCANLTSAYVPRASINVSQNYAFGNCPKLERIALPAQRGNFGMPLAFQNDTALKVVDIGSNAGGFTNQSFVGCSSLDTLILRCAGSVWVMDNVNVFNGTRFASGGAGGTIYIPESLYSHIGDGTALDYTSANNWATVSGYGTITWAKIEGSPYEHTYADGTPV